MLKREQDTDGRRQRKQRRNTERQRDKWDLKCAESDLEEDPKREVPSGDRVTGEPAPEG